MFRTLRFILGLLPLLTLACSGGGGSSPTAQVVPPSALVYPHNPAVYTKGLSVPANVPSAQGDPVTSFSVTPALPGGLALDPLTGEIQGTPTVLAPAGTYTVTGTNAGGSANAPVTITVVDVPPAIAYGSGTFTFTEGTAILPLLPVNTGGAVVDWSVSPDLPPGLAFDSGDGTIQGTPAGPALPTVYTITAANSGGSSTVAPVLTVHPPAPGFLGEPADATANVGEIAAFSASVSGTGPLSFQWYRDGLPLVGATGLDYATPDLALADTGATFGVVVTDAYGRSASSRWAVLTVTAELTPWLLAHPDVAAAIRWQFRAADPANGYLPPGDSDKQAWAAWSQGQKDDLEAAFQATKDWFALGADPLPMTPAGLTDRPANMHPQTANDALTVMQWVDPDYMWRLYIGHVGFALAQELAQPLPWSVTTCSSEGLRYLFDSSVMAWRLPNGNFGMGTYGGANFPPKRADNRPQTTFAAPTWTYPWLRQAGLLGATRQETLGRLLAWMRDHMWHFYGSGNFGNHAAIWQYRGYVPLSGIVTGTLDANYPEQGLQHWTAGCHGSVGFLHAVLRVVNIPVQPVWVSGHELAYFPTEGRYLDHGDDPYNAVVRGLPEVPILNLLIDEATYQARFTSDLTLNITDPSSPALANVGRAAAEFH